jgi:autotransporter-associated beta strand protein
MSQGDFAISNGATLEYARTNTGLGTGQNVQLGTGGGVISVSSFDSAIHMNGVVSGTGGLTKAGAGRLQLSGDNTYAGATVIDQGILETFESERIPNSSAVSINSGTKLWIASTETIGSLDGAGNVEMFLNASLITGGNNQSTAFSGVIGTSGNVTKTGAGTWTLSGANTYTGGTLVNGGTLVVNNTSGSGTGTGTVIVNSGGTLAGSGSVSGAVNVNNEGTLAPGSSIESLDTGALTFNNGSTFAYEIDSDASFTVAADLVNANGNLDIFAGATLDIDDLGDTHLNNPIPNERIKFTLISYAGTWNGGTFDGYADGSMFFVGSNQFVIDYDDPEAGANFGGGEFGNQVTITAVPEASSFIFGGIACVAVAGAHFGRKYFTRRRAHSV